MREDVTAVRVRYPEVDRMAVAHHMHYLAWFELGRTELMRRAGIPYAKVEVELGVQFPVIEVGARYRQPARYDELLQVRTALAEVGGPRVRFAYKIVRADTESLLAEGFTLHAVLGRSGRPVRVPEALRAALTSWSES